MEALKMIPYIVLVLAISGIIGGAAAITLGTFGNSVAKCRDSSYTYNTTSGTTCYNATGYDFAASDAGLVNHYSVGGVSTVSQQFPTLAIISVMVIIISLIAGVFVYMRYF